ncbi:MAG: hypothetical protein PHR36_02425 [Patescibacteria group bacterium]|nr:hypothetical protein [Patescibacteria group bacterium]
MNATEERTLNLEGLFKKIVQGEVKKTAVEPLMIAIMDATEAEEPCVAEIDSLIFRLSDLVQSFHFARVWGNNEKDSFEPKAPEWSAIRLLMEIADLEKNGEFRFKLKYPDSGLRNSNFMTFSEWEKYEKKAYEFIVLKIFRTIAEALKDEDDHANRRLQGYPFFLPLVEWLGSKENQFGHPKGAENIGLFLAQMTERFWGKWQKKGGAYQFSWFEPVLTRLANELGISFEKAEERFFTSLASACVIHLSNARCGSLLFNLAESGFDEILPILSDALFPGHGQTALAHALEGRKIDYMPYTTEFSVNLWWIFQKRVLRMTQRKKTETNQIT